MHSGSVGEYVNKVAPDVQSVELIGAVAFWFIFLGAISIAVSQLGIPALNTSSPSIAAYLPNIIAALLIFVVAGVVAAAVGGLVARTMGDTPTGKIVGSVVPVLVMAIATFMILNQLQIATEIVTITYAALIGGVFLAMALAFGLGGREVAGQMLGDAYDKGREQRGQVKDDMRTARIAPSATPRPSRTRPRTGPATPTAHPTSPRRPTARSSSEARPAVPRAADPFPRLTRPGRGTEDTESLPNGQRDGVASLAMVRAHRPPAGAELEPVRGNPAAIGGVRAAPRRALQLQRAIGNRATVRLLQRWIDADGVDRTDAKPPDLVSAWIGNDLVWYDPVKGKPTKASIKAAREARAPKPVTVPAAAGPVPAPRRRRRATRRHPPRTLARSGG